MSEHQERYNKWAPDYNKDVADRNYQGPEYITKFITDIVNNEQMDLTPDDPGLKVLDVACGTGLVGVELKQRGYHHIDGVDFSQGMITEAHKTGAYESLIGWCDLRKELPFFLHNQYDMTICCGVFALDFVLPLSLKWLVQVTRPGGIIVLTTKKSYYENYDFEGFYKYLIEMGHIKLLECRMDQPYLGDEEDGHYWAFSVAETKKEIELSGALENLAKSHA